MRRRLLAPRALVLVEWFDACIDTDDADEEMPDIDPEYQNVYTMGFVAQCGRENLALSFDLYYNAKKNPFRTITRIPWKMVKSIEILHDPM